MVCLMLKDAARINWLTIYSIKVILKIPLFRLEVLEIFFLLCLEDMKKLHIIITQLHKNKIIKKLHIKIIRLVSIL